MQQRFNFLKGKLTNPIYEVDTEIVVDGPTPGLQDGDYFYVVLDYTEKSGSPEIVKVTNVNDNIFTVERGQYETTPRAHQTNTTWGHGVLAQDVSNTKDTFYTKAVVSYEVDTDAQWPIEDHYGELILTNQGIYRVGQDGYLVLEHELVEGSIVWAAEAIDDGGNLIVGDTLWGIDTEREGLVVPLSTDLLEPAYEDDQLIGLALPSDLFVNDHFLHFRNPGDLNHSMGWGYIKHGVDGILINGYGGVGGAVGDANDNADILVFLFSTTEAKAFNPGTEELEDLAFKSDIEAETEARENALGALDDKADLEGGTVPASQLPSYVDDVLEFPNLASFPATGESGKIYMAADTNITYRWTGSVYVVIGSDLALGETSSTAYRGDRGKQAYDHSQITFGNPHGTTAADVGADPTGSASSAQAAAALDATAKADAKVADSITDGVTTIAPSQNAVFDQLATKSDITHNHNGVYDPAGTAASKVEDTIVDGVADKAPSQNAVHDALLAKDSAALTLTNKRIRRRVLTIASAATPSINTDSYDAVSITALATDITSMTTNLTGTPTNFDSLLFRIKDDNNSRTITWGASFASKGATLPVATTSGKVMNIGFFYNSGTSTWDCVAANIEAA